MHNLSLAKHNLSLEKQNLSLAKHNLSLAKHNLSLKCHNFSLHKLNTKFGVSQTTGDAMQIDLRKISSKHSDAWKTQHGHAWQQEHLFKLTTNHTPSRSEFYSFVCHLRCGIARKIKYKIISATMIQSRMKFPCNTVIVDRVPFNRFDNFRTATNAAAPRHYFMITRCGNLDVSCGDITRY